MLGVKDRVLLRDGICHSHQFTVVLALLTSFPHGDVYHSSDISQPVPAGSGSCRMHGASLSKGQGWMLFLMVLPKLYKSARRRVFPGI